MNKKWSVISVIFLSTFIMVFAAFGQSFFNFNTSNTSQSQQQQTSSSPGSTAIKSLSPSEFRNQLQAQDKQSEEELNQKLQAFSKSTETPAATPATPTAPGQATPPVAAPAEVVPVPPAETQMPPPAVTVTPPLQPSPPAPSLEQLKPSTTPPPASTTTAPVQREVYTGFGGSNQQGTTPGSTPAPQTPGGQGDTKPGWNIKY